MGKYDESITLSEKDDEILDEIWANIDKPETKKEKPDYYDKKFGK